MPCVFKKDTSLISWRKVYNGVGVNLFLHYSTWEGISDYYSKIIRILVCITLYHEFVSSRTFECQVRHFTPIHDKGIVKGKYAQISVKQTFLWIKVFHVSYLIIRRHLSVVLRCVVLRCDICFICNFYIIYVGDVVI